MSNETDMGHSAHGTRQSSRENLNDIGISEKDTTSYNKNGLSEENFSEKIPSKSFFSKYLDTYRSKAKDLENSEKNGDLSRTLSNRHIQMLAIGGAIGLGLFISSGKALSQGGPASLLLSFSLAAIMLFCVINATCEMAIAYPSQNAAYTFVEKIVDSSWGFALGWVYFLQWGLCIPLQIVAAGMATEFYHAKVSVAVFLTIIYVAIIILNLFPIRIYGEVEAILCYTKIIATFGFFILAVVIICGGTPGNGYLGAHTWHDPGPFANGAKGFLSVFIIAAYSFTGTELVGLASTEAKDPIRTMPKASRQIVVRIGLFYLIALFLIGLIVPYNDQRIFSGSSSYDAKASPFVISMQIAGIKVLPELFNAIIVIAILSVGVSATWAASRSLKSLADLKWAPSILGHVDRSGRPMISNIFCLLLGAICYVQLSSSAGEVFDWLANNIGIGSLLSWLSICICHIRFRQALAHNGFSISQLGFRSASGVIGSYVGATIAVLILIIQFYTSLFPLGSKPAAYRFFKTFLLLPLVIMMYFVRKIWKRSRFYSVKNINVFDGFYYFTDEELKVSRAAWEEKSWKKKLMMYIF